MRSCRSQWAAAGFIVALFGCNGPIGQSDALARVSQPSPLAGALARLGVRHEYGTFGGTNLDRAQSWVSPDAVDRTQLLYVTDPTVGDVYILSLPTGKLVGKLTGFDQPLSDCVDQKGDVFVTIAQSAQIRAFKHGARQPYDVLDDHGYYPLGCSVDPTTGNLAVANIDSDGNGSNTPGNIAIYSSGKGKPKFYSAPNIYQYGWCAYDNKGNLFVDGTSHHSNAPEFAELPAHRKNVERISLDTDIGGYEAVQWDGSNVAVGAGQSAAVYQFRISGRRGRAVGSTLLKGEQSLLALWIHTASKGQTLYASVFEHSIGEVGVYRYPSGGKSVSNFYAVVDPWGVTESDKTQ